MYRTAPLCVLFLLIAAAGCGRKERLEQLAAARADSLAHAAFQADSLAEEARWRRTELKSGEGVFQVMQRLGFDNAQALRFSNVLRFEVELVNLKAGEQFAARFLPDASDSGRLDEFQYRENLAVLHRVLVDTAGDSLRYICEEQPTEQRVRFVSGSISAGSSLDQTLLGSGLPPNITQVVNGVLMCKISFRTDARAGDRFGVLLHEEFLGDRIVPERTRVQYVSYEGRRTGRYEAYRYEEPDDSRSTYNAHYTPNGEALIHSGLRYPLDRLHISSGYGWRNHPVTGRRVMHDGVDYKGGIGTPVYAVAAGQVVLAASDPYSGNKIAIRHADGTTSYYLHLDRRLVRKGQRVRTKQIIGRVGRTGRVTGPHLHFGFKQKNGRWMNPLKKRMIATPKLTGERMAAFTRQMELIAALRDSAAAAGRELPDSLDQLSSLSPGQDALRRD